MHVDDEIVFQGALPTIKSIVETVAEISGLKDLTIEKRNVVEIIHHPAFKKREFFILREDNKIILLRGWDDPWYLLDVTIAALITLGGQYDGEQSPWANKKWAEVKMNYPEVSNPWSIF